MCPTWLGRFRCCRYGSRSGRATTDFMLTLILSMCLRSVLCLLNHPVIHASHKEPEHKLSGVLHALERWRKCANPFDDVDSLLSGCGFSEPLVCSFSDISDAHLSSFMIDFHIAHRVRYPASAASARVHGSGTNTLLSALQLYCSISAS